jgi:hypothetical protein
MAISLAAPVLAVEMLFSGFFLNTVDKLSEYIVNLKYLSIFNYGYNLMMINQWKNTSLTCEYSSLGCSISNLTISTCDCTGIDVLNKLNLKTVNQIY